MSRVFLMVAAAFWIFAPPYLLLDNGAEAFAIFWLFGVVPAAILGVLQLYRAPGMAIRWRVVTSLGGAVVFGVGMLGAGALVALCGAAMFFIFLPSGAKGSIYESSN